MNPGRQWGNFKFAFGFWADTSLREVSLRGDPLSLGPSPARGEGGNRAVGSGFSVAESFENPIMKLLLRIQLWH
jgi:hypothetical protein